MSKQKSKSSIEKRFTITKNGKVLRRQAFRRHLKASKSSKRLRNLKKTVPVKGKFAGKIRKFTGK